MKVYKVYQIHLTKEESDHVNAHGHESVAKHLADIDMNFAPSSRSNTEYDEGGTCISELAKDAFKNNYYTHVMNVTDIDDLEDLFQIGNCPDPAVISWLSARIEFLSQWHSLKVGDLIEDENGIQHVVAKFGFDRV